MIYHSSTSRRGPEEALRRLDAQVLDGLQLIVSNIYRPRGREAECRHFELYVKNSDGDISEDAVIDGLYSSGRSSISLKSYFDISFNYKPRFKTSSGGRNTLDLSRSNLDLLFFKALSEVVEAGGKIIVSVSAPARLELINETFRFLDANLPPETTYLGCLLYRCSCGSFFKDWLLREGGREGPPALQGEKPLDEAYRIRGLKESAVRLIKFLEESTGRLGFYESARERAISILHEMRVEDDALQKRIKKVVARHLR